MAHRKYPAKKGRYGISYCIDRGIHVRLDKRKKWTVYINKSGSRKNITIGAGRDGLAKAIKIAEEIKSTVETLRKIPQVEEHISEAPYFKQYSTELLRNLERRRRWSPNTFARYEGVLRLHIFPSPCFSNKRLDQILRKEIRSFFKSLTKSLSPASIETICTVISLVFEEAIEDEYVTVNPTIKILKGLLPRKNERNLKDAAPFTVEERNLFIEKAKKICSTDFVLILELLAYCGLRLGEVLAFSKRGIDLNNKTYLVQESYKQKRFSKPKKGKKRVIDLPDYLFDKLKNYIHQLESKNKPNCYVNYLFLDQKENGEWPYSQRKIQLLMKRVCKHAGLKDRNPHDLRHTYATIMLMSNRTPAYIKEQLGHSSIQITVDIYGHWISGEGRGDIENDLQIPS